MKNQYKGTLLKMESTLIDPVKYDLPIVNEDNPDIIEYVSMTKLIGKYIILKWLKKIQCISCSRSTNKSFAQGFCYPCFITAPETSECILRPELCEAQKGIYRDRS